MARRARQLSPTKIYHIVFRGLNKQDIFRDDRDYERLLRRLLELKKELGFQIYAYCLMTNHAHFLLKEKEHGDISLIMKRLLVSYVQYFNKKYERIGKLINDRYLSKKVKNDAYILNLIRYIHQNPVKIGIPINYKWSSYNNYFCNDENLVDTEFFYSMMNKTEFVRFNNIIETIDFEPSDRIVLSDEEVIEEILEKYKFNPKQVSFMERVERNKILALLRQTYSISQISRITGISKHVVSKQKLEKSEEKEASPNLVIGKSEEKETSPNFANFT